jgi:hypothetical protein
MVIVKSARFVRLLLLAVAILAILGIDLYVVSRPEGTAVTLAEAVDRFRAEAPSTTAPEPAPATDVPRTTSTTASRQGTSSTAAPTTSRDRAATSTTPATTPAGRQSAASRLRPPAGVYRYATDGFESLSIGGERRYPAETTRTILHGAGCVWRMRILLLQEHQEEHVACSTERLFDLTSSSSEVRWFGLPYGSRFDCEPPIRHVDREAGIGVLGTFVCPAGSEGTFSGKTTLLAEETVQFEGTTRPVWRIRIEGRFEGNTRGTVSTTEVIDQETGIVLFEQRVNDLKQRAVLVDVAYRQEVTLTLLSLTPAR